MTKTHIRALWLIRENGPQFNGTLAVMCGVVWNSQIFKHLQKWKCITGHPYTNTDKGLKLLDDVPAELLRRAKQEPKPCRTPRRLNSSF